MTTTPQPAPLSSSCNSSFRSVTEIVELALREALAGIEFDVNATPGLDARNRFWTATPRIFDPEAFTAHLVRRVLASPDIRKEFKPLKFVEAATKELDRKIEKLEDLKESLRQRRLDFEERKATENAKVVKAREELADAVKDFKADKEASKSELAQERKAWDLERTTLESVLTCEAESKVYRDYHDMSSRLSAQNAHNAEIAARLNDAFSRNIVLREENFKLIDILAKTLGDSKEVALKGITLPACPGLTVTNIENGESCE